MRHPRCRIACMTTGLPMGRRLLSDRAARLAPEATRRISTAGALHEEAAPVATRLERLLPQPVPCARLRTLEPGTATLQPRHLVSTSSGLGCLGLGAERSTTPSLSARVLRTEPLGLSAAAALVARPADAELEAVSLVLATVSSAAR